MPKQTVTRLSKGLFRRPQNPMKQAETQWDMSAFQETCEAELSRIHEYCRNNTYNPSQTVCPPLREQMMNSLQEQ